jgi:hypothetical protein
MADKESINYCCCTNSTAQDGSRAPIQFGLHTGRASNHTNALDRWSDRLRLGKTSPGPDCGTRLGLKDPSELALRQDSGLMTHTTSVMDTKTGQQHPISGVIMQVSSLAGSSKRSGQAVNTVNNTLSDLVLHQLGAQLDESATGPATCVEGATANRGRLDEPELLAVLCNRSA